jgi:hypothetical protein
MFNFTLDISEAGARLIAKAVAKELNPLLRLLLSLEKIEMATIDELVAQTDELTVKVAAITAVDQSVVALLTGVVAQNKLLADQLSAAIAANDPAGVQAASDALAAANANLDANIQVLSEAVVANTPAPAPEPEPEPAPEPIEG